MGRTHYALGDPRGEAQHRDEIEAERAMEQRADSVREIAMLSALSEAVGELVLIEVGRRHKEGDYQGASRLYDIAERLRIARDLEGAP